MALVSNIKNQLPPTIQDYTRSCLTNWARNFGGSIFTNENIYEKLSTNTALPIDIDSAEFVEQCMLDLGAFCPKAYAALMHVYLRNRTLEASSYRMKVSINTFRLFVATGESFIGSKLWDGYKKIFT